MVIREYAHSTVVRALGLVGLGRDRVRRVSVTVAVQLMVLAGVLAGLREPLAGTTVQAFPGTLGI